MLIPKYKTLKEEITNNKIYSLNISSFNDSNEKAINLNSNSNHIKAIKASYEYSESEYGIDLGSSLSINNVLSVILYTD